MEKKKDMFHWFMWQGVGAFSWFMWISSTFLSYWGFTRLATSAPWWVKTIAFGVSAGINFVEFMLDNLELDEILTIRRFGDVVLRLFGLVCYAYDIYTNILGFIGVVGISTITTLSVAQAWGIDPTMTMFAITFGFLIAVGPEPLYILFLEKTFPFPIKRNPTPNNYTKPKTNYTVPDTYAKPRDFTVPKEIRERFSSDTVSHRR